MNMEPIARLSKDLKNASKTLTDQEARYLVDTYYQVQEFRKATSNQIRSMTETEEPTEVIEWLLKNLETLENQIKRALDTYTKAHPVGQWLKKNPGQPGDVSRILIEHNPSQYYIDKVRNEVFEKLQKEGAKIKVTSTRPKYLILRNEEEEAVNVEPEEIEEEERTDTEVVCDAGPDSIREAYMRVHSTIKSRDRRFLEEKAEELQLQITDAQERLELMKTRLTTEIEIYEELLQEITRHLGSQEV